VGFILVIYENSSCIMRTLGMPFEKKWMISQRVLRVFSFIFFCTEYIEKYYSTVIF